MSGYIVANGIRIVLEHVVAYERSTPRSNGKATLAIRLTNGNDLNIFGTDEYIDKFVAILDLNIGEEIVIDG